MKETSSIFTELDLVLTVEGNKATVKSSALYAKEFSFDAKGPIFKWEFKLSDIRLDNIQNLYNQFSEVYCISFVDFYSIIKRVEKIQKCF